ncbi:hypothetical protein [Mammaliicoccus stepanovicii]|uniref:Membrane protein n=1 Tax=Mammaliicoccus stepanovicii TaxID=643214 RepID=A0A239YRH3_9STAP|nr:hypothetical protein [Mammaliicoccus stepanovicii]GGI42435.1 hypothetical protein GCM10010896_18410 [Mammaliicoccus stepanovicii]SNV61123.1 membrane protein [Mammaliicoccus stepanovicii]
MSNITKSLVGLAIVTFIIGLVMELSGHSGIQFTFACILFLVAAFINRSSDRKRQNRNK